MRQYRTVTAMILVDSLKKVRVLCHAVHMEGHIEMQQGENRMISGNLNGTSLRKVADRTGLSGKHMEICTHVSQFSSSLWAGQFGWMA